MEPDVNNVKKYQWVDVIKKHSTAKWIKIDIFL